MGAIKDSWTLLWNSLWPITFPIRFVNMNALVMNLEIL